MSILLAVKVNIYSYVNQSHECRQNIAVGAIYREINPSPTVCACKQSNRNGRPANVLGRRHRQITPPRRDHPPRASTRALVRSLRRTFPFDQRGTSQPSTRSLDRTVHSRVRRPAARAAGHEEFKRTLAPRRAYTFRLCDYDRRRRVPRVPTQLCAAPRCPPAPLDGSIPTPPFTRDPPPDRPPSRPPPFTISRNLVVAV